jgi:hypothetical protein
MWMVDEKRPPEKSVLGSAAGSAALPVHSVYSSPAKARALVRPTDR